VYLQPLERVVGGLFWNVSPLVIYFSFAKVFMLGSLP
jgi:hypothetical protein